MATENQKENSYLNFQLSRKMLISAAFLCPIKMLTLVRSNQTKILCVTYQLVARHPKLTSKD